MYTVKKLQPGTILETIPVNGKTIKNIVTTNGGQVSYIVVDGNGSYTKSATLDGKTSFNNFLRKSAAQMQANWMNENN